EVGGHPVAAYFGSEPGGNWEGTNVLWTPMPAATVAAEFGIDEQGLLERVELARGELFARRQRRVRPATDDKVLAGWNGLAIAALAEAGRALNEPRYLDAATRAAEFVLASLRRDG